MMSPFHKVNRELYPWDIAYFEHLIAELNALDAPPTDPALQRAQALIRDFRSNQGDVTRSNLLELEQTLLTLQSTETLMQRAPILRLRYREVVGESQYRAYTPVDVSKLPLSDPSAREILLSDLKNLVSGIHWRYVLMPLLDKVQTGLTFDVITCVVSYTVGWSLILFLTGHYGGSPFLSMLETVIYAGIIGGFVSSLRRVQQVRPDTDSLLTIQALQSSQYFLWLSPLLGAIFAVVLLLVFLAGLVGGTVFPQFQRLDCPDCSFAGNIEGWPLWTKLCPSSSESYAKLFLWSFIAGFAERFVPDILDRVIQRGQDASARAAGAGEPKPPKPPSPLPKDAAEKEAAAKLAADKESAAREAKMKEAAAKKALEKEPAEPEASNKVADAMPGAEAVHLQQPPMEPSQ